MLPDFGKIQKQIDDSIKRTEERHIENMASIDAVHAELQVSNVLLERIAIALEKRE